MHPAARHPSRALAAIAALASLSAAHAAFAQVVPLHDRVVVVVMENKSYNQVSMLPYTASFRAAGATFTNSRAITRPSQPNYFALFAGNTFGINTNSCPIPGSPYPYPNLGQACEAAGKTWKAYSENLPSPGSTVCSADGDPVTGLYTRKHAPWTYFTNIDHNNERPYSDLAADLAAHALPNLAFIVPNNCHNTHNSSTPGCSLLDGDAWLAANLPPILAELGPNGILILTYDEDDGSSSNHILTALVGPKVIPGSTYTPVANLYAVSRLISEMLDLPILGFGVLEESIIGIWEGVTPTRGTSWGEVKTIYR
jgi:hypothetical protein